MFIFNIITVRGKTQGLDEAGGAKGCGRGEAEESEWGSAGTGFSGGSSVLIDSSRGIVPIVKGNSTSRLNDIPGVFTFSFRV